MRLLLRQKQKLNQTSILILFSERSFCCVVACALLFCSCSSSKSTYSRSASSDFSKRNNIVSLASKQKGDSYVYGAKGPDRFDCSGLVNYVYNKNGIDISGSAASIFKHGISIKSNQAKPGDLVFYRKNGKIFHVSIITKREKKELWVIHSTSSKGVIEENVLASRYWEPMIYRIVSLDSLRD